MKQLGIQQFRRWMDRHLFVTSGRLASGRLASGRSVGRGRRLLFFAACLVFGSVAPGVALAQSQLGTPGVGQVVDQGYGPATEAAVFSPDDRDRALRFWSDGSRYSAGIPSDVSLHGLYQVRLTVAGSIWLDKYVKLSTGPSVASLTTGGDTVPVAPPSDLASSRPGGSASSRSGRRGSRQTSTGLPVPPTATGRGANPVWESWVAAKVASDRYNAQILADGKNASLGLQSSTTGLTLVPPTPPGPCPADLVAVAGDPPCFAEQVTQTEYTVRFDDATFVLRDHCACSPRYRSYRFEEGVDFGGTPLTRIQSDRLAHLARLAGIDNTALHVFTAVSNLEGGFDALNTYDTGYVSVGFIQFAALREGNGSLAELLLKYKASNPGQFDLDFRSFGIDVTPSGKLAVLDLETGVELHGADANARIITDKRLAAAFARAGQRSDAFIAAQIASAYASFYPADDAITLNLSGVPTQVKVRDFMHSEAGLATLTDLKVNRGDIRNQLRGVVQQIADRHQARSVSDLAAQEREIMVAMKYRKDFSKDLTLSQPGGGNLATTPGTSAEVFSPVPIAKPATARHYDVFSLDRWLPAPIRGSGNP